MAKSKKLKVFSLGGLGEIGKNITVLEYCDNILIIDCGIGFPDNDLLGVDLVTPDFTYLIDNYEKIVGLIVTHGHEDHIGSIPYLLQKINIPVYATKLTLGILENKFEEHDMGYDSHIFCIEAGMKFNLGVFGIEVIRVNHSIADSVCFSIDTPVGKVFITGDFKIDSTPIDGEMMDLTRIGEIGREGVKLLLCESTNVERPGYTPSERRVGESLVGFFDAYNKKRIVISTFSSNVHRVQQVINISAKHNRKVAITGRSMLNVVKAADKLGYMNIPEGTLIDITEAKKYPPNQVTIVSTGSQGEPMSGLYRMAFGMHSLVELGHDDLVIISASSIPGNEKLVNNIVNELYKRGVSVITDSDGPVHVSGHACQEELKIIHALLKPEYFMPIHGEAKHLYKHKELAQYMGMKPNHIFVSEIGKVLEIDGKSAKFNGTVPAGVVYIDGSGIGDVGNIVLKDRRKIGEAGLVLIVATLDFNSYNIMDGPEVITRGFVYEKESEALLSSMKEVATDALNECMYNCIDDRPYIKGKVKDEVAKFVYQNTKRKPMVMTVIMEAEV